MIDFFCEHRPRDHDAAVLPDVRHPGPLAQPVLRHHRHLRQGWSWTLSIIFLTIVIRIALIPLFVKQIKNSRNLQLLQPKVKELQKKYGHDRERLTQETMKLYKETGTNPLASCLPLLLQMPIFLALFRTLNEAADGDGVGFMTDSAGQVAWRTRRSSACTISDSFTHRRQRPRPRS